MPPIEDPAAAELRHLYRDVAAKLVSEPDEGLDREMKAADDVMDDMNGQIEHLTLSRYAWAAFAVFEAVVLGYLVSKHWDAVKAVLAGWLR